MAGQDPLRHFRYRLEIDGIDRAGFAEVSMGDLSTDPIEYREGDDIITLCKLNGLDKYGNITLKRGITDSTEFAEWHRLVVDDGMLPDRARRTVVIRIQDESGEDTAAFEVTRAWPCKYDPLDLNAKGNEVAIDTLELCNEGIKRIE